MKNKAKFSFRIGITLLLGLWLTACNSLNYQPAMDEDLGLEIVVTTTFIGDVLRQVAGEIPQITVLLEPGQNPHSYHPTPQDMVNISRADAIFINGLDLEEFLDDLLDGSNSTAELIVVSEGIQMLGRLDLNDPKAMDSETDEDHDHSVGNDPHVWFDPNNLIVWTDNIINALSELDPDNKSDYMANGQAYKEELIALDTWIRAEVDSLPEMNRKLVTDHTSLGYFVEEYGFTQVGAVIPALTTEAETSGQELAGLIDMIRENQVKAIFIGIDFDPTLAERVAEETGVDLIPLYFGSLSDGEPAGTYLDFMYYDVSAIINGLK